MTNEEFLKGFEKLVEKIKPDYLSANRSSPDRQDWVDNGEVCTTQQHFKDKLDINNIVKQYVAQGYRSTDFEYMAGQVYSDASRFLDISTVGDVFEATQLMQEAKDTFIKNIPSQIREKFANDPIAFYRYVSNPANDVSIRNLFKDIRNYSVPTVEQLQEGSQRVPEVVKEDNK